MIYNFFVLWKVLPLIYKRKFIFLLFMMVFSAVVEVVSIGSIVPFLSFLIDPSSIIDNEFISDFMSQFNLNESSALFVFSVLFMVLAIFSGLFRLMLLWLNTSFSYKLSSTFSEMAFRSAMNKTYLEHKATNSSEVINLVTGKIVALIGSVVIPALNILSGFFVLLLMISVLSYVDIQSVILSGAFIIFSYALIVFSTKSMLKRSSEIFSRKSTLVVKIMQEGLGGIRDVILQGNEEDYIKRFHEADVDLKTAQSKVLFASASPRYLLETLGIVFIVLFSIIALENNRDLAQLVPMLGVLVLSAQRLLPIFQQGYSSITTIMGAQHIFSESLTYLKLSPDENFEIQKGLGDIRFDSIISFKNAYFGYPGTSNFVFENLNLKIEKGDKFGVIGETGVGKSTFIDLLMGLLPLESGSLSVDGKEVRGDNEKSWRKKISHVPQEIYLLDDSIANNIVFGAEDTDIDVDKLKSALKKAQLEDFVSQLQAGIHTLVGERGAQLSGGQKQRVGIARAFYKDADLYVLDEATSALDTTTEKLIMNEFMRLNKTVVVIAHRLSTLSETDYILSFTSDGINKISYSQVGKIL